ncbi:egg-laying defective protein 26-like [Mercenaria mercenaria]|uniref:egg-laying defective protein 26-like n=1 Tax=Mercenaria mercenaria TaxID=6596 RepID=UPI00234E4050|nr:egg-laying defective protein 26-like [Mercenaria mercenaria]
MANISITAENITQLRSLKRGDHIAVQGEMAGVKYYHHGIFLGHEIGVADFNGTNKMNAIVRVIDILEFIGQGKRRLIRYIYKSSECLPAEEAARNAEALAANPRLWGAYDVVKNNCEHFATRCKVGRAVSFQVASKLGSFIAGVAVVSLFSPALAIGSVAVGGIFLANINKSK